MSVNYSKYSATGNTFVMLDNRDSSLPTDEAEVWSTLAAKEHVDGIIFVEKSESADIKMRYLNADGGEVEMCGNGGRAIAVYAKSELGIDKNKIRIETMNGIYETDLSYVPKIKMTEVSDVDAINIEDLFPHNICMYVKTGVPHSVFQVFDVDAVKLMKDSPAIRNDERFENGCNVNYFQLLADKRIRMRTFERGVEGETLSCGTGATATAITCFKNFGWTGEIKIETRGGDLVVEVDKDLKEIYLAGQVEKIGSGSFDF